MFPSGRPVDTVVSMTGQDVPVVEIVVETVVAVGVVSSYI